MSKKVFIKTIPRESANKIHEFKNNRTGKLLNKTKIFENCKDGIRALYSPKVGGLKTGMYKKYLDTDKTIQEWAEDKWGLERGALTNRPWKKGDSLADDKLTYFQKKAWKLNDGTTVLDLNYLDDFCFYHVALDSKFIANSEREWKEHRWPKATHYISHENEPDELKMRKNNRKALCFSTLVNPEFTLPWKRKFVVLLDLASDRITLSEEQITNLIYDAIDKSENHDGPTFINKYLSKFNMLEKADEKEHLESEYLLKSLVDWRIVIEKAGTYTWFAKEMQIGFNKDEAIDFLKDPRKQSLIDELKEELKLKKI
jgi:hypothetical protein